MKCSLKILLVVVLIAACVYASLRNSPFLAELPFMPVWMGRWLDENQNIRHLAAYAGLAMICGAMFCLGRVTKCWLVSAGLLLLLALGLEAAQLLLPARHPDWQDVAWSWAGILGGFWGTWGFHRMTLRNRSG